MSGETVALDLFAGTGWGVALQARGIREGGVEIMPEAQASRAAAGMETIYSDVWDGLLSDDPIRFPHSLQIASPPCQSFSLAGKGAGRAALDDVLRAIDDRAFERPERLRSLGAETDDRTALVLTPLAHVHRDRPMFVTWEQVPPVLPVWEACAAVMRDMGYSVWVGIIRAEQYGVPQTRRRAVLIARADGIDAAPPTPTHSRYYEREPQRLDEGVLKWVSMAEALGFGDFTAHKVMGRGMVERHGDRPGREASEPAFTIRASAGGMEPGGFVLRPGGSRDALPAWCAGRPATTVVADPRLGGPGRSEFVKGGVSCQNRPGSVRLEAHEAAALQAYPVGFPFRGGKGKQFLQIGNAVPPLIRHGDLGRGDDRHEGAADRAGVVSGGSGADGARGDAHDASQGGGSRPRPEGAACMSRIIREAFDQWRECREDFDTYREAAYARAVDATNGALLNDRGRRAGIDSVSLFMGPLVRALAYASPELVEHWQVFPRVTFDEFERQWVQAREDEWAGVA